MAYAAGDWRVQVRGAIGGFEEWVNTWSFKTGDASPSVLPGIIEPLNAFYEDLAGFASWFSTGWTHVSAVARDLDNDLTYETSWSGGAGSSASDMLPSATSLRISVSTPQNHGGPFLCGFTANALNATGRADQAMLDDIAPQLELMISDVADNGYVLALDRPTVPSMVAATKVRIGNRFDVIRKRSNDTAEAYTVIALP